MRSTGERSYSSVWMLAADRTVHSYGEPLSIGRDERPHRGTAGKLLARRETSVIGARGVVFMGNRLDGVDDELLRGCSGWTLFWRRLRRRTRYSLSPLKERLELRKIFVSRYEPLQRQGQGPDNHRWPPEGDKLRSGQRLSWKTHPTINCESSGVTGGLLTPLGEVADRSEIHLSNMTLTPVRLATCKPGMTHLSAVVGRSLHHSTRCAPSALLSPFFGSLFDGTRKVRKTTTDIA